MVRFMAASAKPLTKDANLTPLGAFDTLQRIHRKYADKWLAGCPWIVCMDGFCDITPKTPLQQAIELIEEHKGFAGIVGVAIITGQFQFLKKPLKSGKKIHELLDWSGNIAADKLLKKLEPIAAASKKMREEIGDKGKHS
jgi:hypothetical protein